MRIRDIRVTVDRPDTTLNPTSCDPMAVDAHVTGTGGDVNSTADDTAADLSHRFQAANCSSARLRPEDEHEAARRQERHHPLQEPGPAGHPDARERATPTSAPPSSPSPTPSRSTSATSATSARRKTWPQTTAPANTRSAAAAPPRRCSTHPLSGPVYAVSGPNTVLPQLVFVLHGQFDALVKGDNEGVGNHLRTSFPSVPDVPVSSFQLTIDGGKGGYLVNTRDVCAKKNTSLVQMIGHNGKTETLKVPLQGAVREGAQEEAQGKAPPEAPQRPPRPALVEGGVLGRVRGPTAQWSPSSPITMPATP